MGAGEFFFVDSPALGTLAPGLNFFPKWSLFARDLRTTPWPWLCTVRCRGMRTVTREHYHFIDFLRVVACSLVVLHHCLGYFGSASFVQFYTANLKMFFPTVTLYLLVSGFVHCGVIESKGQPYRHYVWDKFKRIMVPYFVVSLLTLALRVAVERNHLLPLDQVQYTPFVWEQAGLRVLFSGVEGHYYFLEVLFLYLLGFPFLMARLATPQRALYFFLGAVALDPFLAQIYTRYQGPQWSPLGLVAALLSGFKFFLFGFVLNRFFPLVRSLGRARGAWLGIGCLGAFLSFRWLMPAGNEYWVFFELLGYFSLAFLYFNRPYDFVTRIAGLSFGIYLLHQPYFIKLSRTLAAHLNPSLNFQLLATWTLTLGLTFLTVSALEKNRQASRLLLGK